jgi:hypothetical protein
MPPIFSVISALPLSFPRKRGTQYFAARTARP